MVVIYRERNCAENYAKLHNKIIPENLHTVIECCLIKIAADNLSLKLFKIFALRMASSVKQHCAGPIVSI